MSGALAAPPVPVRILILYEDSRVAIAIAARAMDCGAVELARLEDSSALLQASEPADLVILCPRIEDPTMPGRRLPIPVDELPPVLRVRATGAGGFEVDASDDDMDAIASFRPPAHEVAMQLLLSLRDPGAPGANGMN